MSILLRSHGFEITPEAVAQLAGSVLPVGDPASWLPTGASPKDPSIPLPTTASESDAGTSAQGLIAAVSQLTQNAYCLLPLQARWSGDRVTALLQLCQSWQTVPLCNVQTGRLWGSSLAVSDAIAYLNGEPISPPPADWSVGHFLTLAGSIQGAAKQLIVVCDTYLQFGWQGYHLQSPEAVAQALNREDGYGGGVLLFIRSEHRATVCQQAEAMGLTIEVWDNGSPM